MGTQGSPAIFQTSFPSWCLWARKDDPQDNTYLLYADEPMERFDFSLIPTPSRIRALMEGDQAGKVGQVGKSG